MKTIVFATGNSRKIQEATTALAPFAIELESKSLDMDEIQHSNPAEITKAKARAAYEVVHQPVVVSDTSWSVPALGGFPGGYMKDIAAWLSEDDWLAMMARHDDRTIYCHEHVAYFDGEELEHFESTYKGYFATEARGRVQEDESFERVVVLYGNKTMGEQLAENDIASASETHEHWRQFGEWFSRR